MLDSQSVKTVVVVNDFPSAFFETFEVTYPVSFGALSVGYFSVGALAVGKYAAVGDHAYAMIAIGESVAEGIAYTHVGDLTAADIGTVVKWLDANVPDWLGWAKAIFKFFIQ